MGFNISGIAINKNLNDSLDTIEDLLGWHLNEATEISFEEASSNWKEEGWCDIYFTDKGTLIFLNVDMCINEYHMLNQEVLTFCLFEGPMTFNLNYSKNKKLLRSIMQVEGQFMTNSGSKLEVEVNENDVSEIIWKKLKNVLGISYMSIDLEAKAMRFKLAPSSAKSNEIISGVKNPNAIPWSDVVETLDAMQIASGHNKGVSGLKELIKKVESDKLVIFKDGKNISVTSLDYLQELISGYDSNIKVQNYQENSVNGDIAVDNKLLKTTKDKSEIFKSNKFDFSSKLFLVGMIIWLIVLVGIIISFFV